MAIAKKPTPLRTYVGTSELKQITLTEDGDPFDLTPYTGEWTFYCKNDADDDTSVFTLNKNVDGDIAITDATGGVFTIQLDKADLPTKGRYPYYLIATLSGGQEELLMEGTLHVLRGGASS